MKKNCAACLVIAACWVIASISTTLAFAPLTFHRRSGTKITTITARLTTRPQLDDNNNEECSILEDESIFACLTDQGYVEDPSISIQKVFVADIESLRNNKHFTSFEPQPGSSSDNNTMQQYNQRLRRRRRRHSRHPVHHSFGMQSSNNTTVASTEPTYTVNSHRDNLEYNRVVNDHEVVLVDTVRKPATTTTDGPQSQQSQYMVSRAFHRAGPRQWLHFDPSTVSAAIVTCGGLCPGLNNVIRELVHALYYLYGARAVWGVTGGFHGFCQQPGGDGGGGYYYGEPILLTNEMVENIHHEGGTVLRSSRGGFDIDKILDFVRQRSINQLFIIGGDGTHRAAYKIHQACLANNMNVAVAGIPKTIDNDVDYIDRSFGFMTAVEAAQNSIRTAKIGRYITSLECVVE
jgi:6-phosphofructokinase 1